MCIRHINRRRNKPETFGKPKIFIVPLTLVFGVCTITYTFKTYIYIPNGFVANCLRHNKSLVVFVGISNVLKRMKCAVFFATTQMECIEYWNYKFTNGRFICCVYLEARQFLIHLKLYGIWWKTIPTKHYWQMAHHLRHTNCELYICVNSEHRVNRQFIHFWQQQSPKWRLNPFFFISSIAFAGLKKIQKKSVVHSLLLLLLLSLATINIVVVHFVETNKQIRILQKNDGRSFDSTDFYFFFFFFFFCYLSAAQFGDHKKETNFIYLRYFMAS